MHSGGLGRSLPALVRGHGIAQSLGERHGSILQKSGTSAGDRTETQDIAERMMPESVRTLIELPNKGRRPLTDCIQIVPVVQ